MDDLTQQQTTTPAAPETSWRDSLPPEYKDKYMEYATPADFVKGYDNVYKAFSGKKETIKAELEAELKAGLPKSSAEYKFDIGKELDPELTGKFAGVAHELGLSNEQAQKLIAFQDSLGGELSAKAHAAGETALKNEWLNKYDDNVAIAKETWNKFPEEIKQAIGSDARYGSDPVLIKMMHYIGTTLSDKPIGVPNVAPVAVTAESIQTEMAGLYKKLTTNNVTSTEYKEAAPRYKELQTQLSKMLNS